LEQATKDYDDAVKKITYYTSQKNNATTEAEEEKA
jgi:hypothetical protein